MAELELLADLKLPTPEGSDARHAIARNYVPQVVTFGRSGDLEVTAGTHRWYADRAWVIKEVRASVGTVPTGSDAIIDVNLNGTTIFSTQGNRPTIAVSTNTDGSNVPDVTTMVDGDYLTVDIDQIGSTTPGADLTVQVVLEIA